MLGVLGASLFSLVAVPAAFTACGSSSGSGTGGHGTTSSGSLTTGTAGGPQAGDSVLTHHRNASRDGVYVQPTFTKAAAKNLTKDAAFNAVTDGATYAQPLFVDGGATGKDMLLVATEKNNVYALDPVTGAQIWKASLGAPVPLSKMGCGNIDPFGVTGTPAIDLASRTMFLDALVDDGGPAHRIFAISIDDGSVKPGWPIDVASKVKAGNISFDPQFHGERGAVAVVGGTLYVPFGGLWGDCGNYHGWIVAVSISDPTKIQAWATPAKGGGSWAPSGVASDGSSVYIATGNTIGASDWGGGEAILRFGAGSSLGATPADYWAPNNWLDLDNADIDIGGSGPVLFDVPGSNPAGLAVSLGKDGNIYLLDRGKLGSISDPIAQLDVSSNEIINAAVAYTTSQGTYVVFKGDGTQCTGSGGDLTAVLVKAGSPPSLEGSWCASQNGLGSPMVTTTDGHAEAIVWSTGAEGDRKLHGFDGDTGEEIFDGGGVTISGLRRYNTPIAAKGRIYVAADNGVVAFKL
jgi:hypothetical protein